MNISLNKDFVENSYYKAFDHHLRTSDSKSVTILANVLFNEFIRLLGNKEIDLTPIIEKRHENEEQKVLVTNIINPHHRRDDRNDIFFDTRGWCWSCWKMKRISELEKELSEYKARV